VHARASPGDSDGAAGDDDDDGAPGSGSASCEDDDADEAVRRADLADLDLSLPDDGSLPDDAYETKRCTDLAAFAESLPDGRPASRWTGPSAGCTAVVAVVRGDQLVVANAGDSRCVFSRGGRAVAMTQDHKPTDDKEHERIMKVRGAVMGLGA
jgi:Protein phosphatase 2C